MVLTINSLIYPQYHLIASYLLYDPTNYNNNTLELRVNNKKIFPERPWNKDREHKKEIQTRELSREGPNYSYMHKLLFVFRINKDFTKALIDRFFECYQGSYKKRLSSMCLKFKSSIKLVLVNGEKVLSDKIFYAKTKGAFRKKLYIMALYLGYIWYTKTLEIGNHTGYEMEDRLQRIYQERTGKGDYKESSYTYRELKRNKIFNPEYFDLVEDSNNPLDRVYKIIEDLPYKIGTTYEYKEVTLVKL